MIEGGIRPEDQDRIESQQSPISVINAGDAVSDGGNYYENLPHGSGPADGSNKSSTLTMARVQSEMVSSNEKTKLSNSYGANRNRLKAKLHLEIDTRDEVLYPQDTRRMARMNSMSFKSEDCFQNPAQATNQDDKQSTVTANV